MSTAPVTVNYLDQRHQRSLSIRASNTTVQANRCFLHPVVIAKAFLRLVPNQLPRFAFPDKRPTTIKASVESFLTKQEKRTKSWEDKTGTARSDVALVLSNRLGRNRRDARTKKSCLFRSFYAA